MWSENHKNKYEFISNLIFWQFQKLEETWKMDTILIESVNDNLTDELKFVIDAYQNDLFIYDKPLNAILISTYVPLFLIALTSNILIILVVGRYRCLRR